MCIRDRVIEDSLSLRLSLRAHPMELLRPRLPDSLPHDRLPQAKGRITVTGLVITRQRPGTASGVIFLTLEDETGNSNIVVWQRTQQQFRQPLMTAQLLLVNGTLESKNNVIHIIAGALYDYSHELQALQVTSRDFR